MLMKRFKILKCTCTLILFEMLCVLGKFLNEVLEGWLFINGLSGTRISVPHSSKKHENSYQRYQACNLISQKRVSPTLNHQWHSHQNSKKAKQVWNLRAFNLTWLMIQNPKKCAKYFKIIYSSSMSRFYFFS